MDGPCGGSSVGPEFSRLDVAVIEVEVHLLCGSEVRLPLVQVRFGCQHPCCLPECPVAIMGQSFVLRECDQAVCEGSPQEFGGNQLVAAVPEFLVCLLDQTLCCRYVFFLVHGAAVFTLARRLARSTVILANMVAS